MARLGRVSRASVIGCLVLVGGVSLSVILSCKRREPIAPAAPPPPSLACFQSKLDPGELTGWNVLFVTFDTTRADHIGCYGYTEAETPTIDRLAARGVKFDHAIADVPSTLPSHSTMMTGLLAPHHGVRTNGFFTLQEDQTTLAEVLKERGYATAAFVSTYVLHGKFGLRQGFDTYDHIGPGTKHMSGPRRAEDVTELATAWLTQHLQENPRQPWLLWPHYFDPHEKYDPPGEYAVRFADRLYDGEIAYADAHFGRLLEFLESKGQLERTLIILTSDHGEGLGEHLEETHSRLIYDTTVHVPLILSCPQLHDSPCRVDDITVGTIDIMPTVLSLLGIESDVAFDGMDLTTTSVDPARAMYIETLSPLAYHGWASLHGLRTIDAKYIESPNPEYYRVRTDPAELNNLFEADPQVVSELRTRLAELMSDWPAPEVVARTATPLSKHSAERLAALGYVTSDISDGSEDASLPDPKDMVPLFDTLNHATAETMNAMAWEIVTSPESDSGAKRRAVILGRTANHKKPENATYLTTLGAALYRTRAYGEAAEELVRAEALPTETGQAADAPNIAFKAMALHQLGRTDQARTELQRLRTLMGEGAEPEDRTARTFLQEAEAVVGGP